MYLIQFLLAAFFIFAALKTIQRYRAEDIGTTVLVGWLLLWSAGMVVVLSPNSTFYFAHILGVQRGVDAVVYLALALLFFVVFRLIAQVEHLERSVTLLTRALALKKDDTFKK